MPNYNIPALEPMPISWDPQSAKPFLGSERRVTPNCREIVASRKVDDLARHESKHDLDPKHDPKHNAREKKREETRQDKHQPQGENPVPRVVGK